MSKQSSVSQLGKRRRDMKDDYGRQNTPGLFVTPEPSSLRSTPQPDSFPPSGRQSTPRISSRYIPSSTLSIPIPDVFTRGKSYDSATNLKDMDQDTDDQYVKEEDEEDEDEEDEDEDEDEEDDSDNDDDQEYHQLKEPLPEHPAYYPHLTELKNMASNMLGDLQQLLDPYLNTSNYILNVAMKAENAIEHSQPEKPTILFLGATGTGKSSTVNSVLDDLTASKAVASGESVTCVPIVITSSDSDSYTAEIRFMGRETCQEFLQLQIRNYIRWEFERDDSWDAEEREEHSALHDIALKILRAPFCQMLEFSSPGNIRQYLEQHGDAVIRKLMIWYDEIFSEYERKDGQPYLTFDAPDGLHLNNQIDPHIFQNSDFDKAALWPLVEHVHKGIPGSRILEHINLIDAPGTGDQDRVRAAIAQKFVEKCDALWVISTIKRVVSDAYVHHALATYGERFANKVSVIATGSDTNVDSELAKDLQDKKQSIGDYWQLREQISALRSQLKTLKKKKRISSVTHYRRKLKIEERINLLRDQELEVLVEARNSYVARCFKRSKQGHLADVGTLPIFCISNTHYESHKGKDSEDSRLMSVDTTNIPSLRAYALTLAAPAEFRAADTHITRAATILKGAAYWVDGTGCEQHYALMDLCKAPTPLLNALVEANITSAKATFDSKVVAELNSKQHIFVNTALGIKNTLSGLAWNSLRAFFRKDGRHTPRGQPFKPWNERFVEKQNETLNKCWKKAMLAYRESLDDFMDNIVNQLDQLSDALGESAPILKARLKQLLQGYSTRIRATYHTRLQAMEKSFSNIKLKASRDVADGYYTQAMRPMYDKGKADSGPGLKLRLLKLLHKYLSDIGPKSPVASVPNGITQHVHAGVTATSRGLKSDIKAVLKEMTLQFDAMFKKKLQGPGEVAARVKLRPLLVNILARAEAMEQDLAKIRESDMA